ncbi:MAG: hypothetical protein ACRDYX_21950 [Egibacteraceae bacterium]|uniref:hypothetical protein n=1 Tax=Novosphingobium sp. TaxID=1874826 RepID=UPI003D6CA0CC
MTAEEALSQVKALVDATLVKIAPNAKLTSDAVEGGTACESSVSGPTGQRSYGYSFSFPVPDEATGKRLVSETAKFWKGRGHQVTGDLDDQYSPFVHTSEDGFNFDLTFARQTLRASVGGSTPCVDPLPGDK